jgi:hypothetical protein
LDKLELIKSKPAEKDRIKAASWLILCPFLLKYEILINSRKYKPQFIINFDEINTNKEQTMKTYQLKLKHIETTAFHILDHLSSSTVLFTTSADGESFPVILIIPYKNTPSKLISYNSTNFRIYPSPSGFMTKELLEKNFEEIIIKGINDRRLLLNWQSEPALVVIDGHTSRNSQNIFQMCIRNNVDLICLPGHTSNILQPHDLRLNSVFSNNLKFSNVPSSFNSLSEKRISFIESVKDACTKSLTTSVIKDSWCFSRLYPFQPLQILSENPIFTPSFIKIKKKPKWHKWKYFGNE